MVDGDQLITRAAAAYSDLLQRSGGPALSDPVVRRQLTRQAEAVMHVVGRTCLHGSFSDETPADTSEHIGESRARTGIHPTQSLLAASLMFEALFPVLVGAAPRSDDVVSLGTTLEREIQRRLTVGAIPYIDYLLTRLLSSQQDERSRIARDLHDRAAHGMGAALQQLELFEHYQALDPQRADDHLATARQAMTDSVDCTRQLSADLWVRVTGTSVSDALTSYLDSAAPDTIDTNVLTSGGEPDLPDEIIQELYLVLREAVRNAILHAGPSHIVVALTTERDRFRAVITDDGCGFDVDAVITIKSVGGLASIRERTELLGGRATITAAPGRGTTVDVQIPLFDRAGTGGTR